MHSQDEHSLPSGSTLAQADELLQQVIAQLNRRLGSQLRDFHITVTEGGLILRGQTRTHYGKQLAQEVAREVTRRLILANEIKVHDGAGQSHIKEMVAGNSPQSRSHSGNDESICNNQSK